MVPTQTPIWSWVDLAKETDVDFIFADSGVYSCIGVERGATALATKVAHEEVRGRLYDLDVYGGMFA